MRKSVAYLTAVVLTYCLFSFGQSEYSIMHAQQQSAPELKRIGPDTISAGSPTFTIRLEGKNFLAGARVVLDGVSLSSSRISSKGKILLAEVPASVVAAPGTHTVQAVNPDGGASAVFTLTVVERDPNLRIRLGGNAAQEDLDLTFEFEITGEGFNEGTDALIWGFNKSKTRFISDEKLIVQLPAKYTRDAAFIPITVRRNGRLSNTDIFFIVPRPPRIDDVDPESITVGTEDVEIDVFGREFKDDAQVLLNGVPLQISKRKDDRIEAILPAAFRQQPGLLFIRVEQEGIQSANEVITVTPTDGPFLTAIAPVQIRQTEKRTSIDVIGANLGENGITAFVDGQEARIRDRTGRRLTVVISEELSSQLGTHTVQVKDKDGNLSGTAIFEVVPDVTVSTLVGGSREGFDTGCVSGDKALLRRPRRITLAPDGLLYFTDQQNHAIRSVDPATREVCTIMGTGVPGYKDTGDTADAVPAFSFPNGLAVAADGTIYVSENGNDVLRRIQPTAVVDTFAGANVLIEDKDKQKKLNSTREGLEGFRDGTSIEANFRNPDDLLIAPDGSIYVADASNHAIRRITFVGNQPVVETVAGNSIPGFADGQAENARFNAPTALALSQNGRLLFIADLGNNRIRVIDLVTRRVDTFAGNGDSLSLDGPSYRSSFAQPIGLAIDSDGVLYVSEFAGNRIRRVDAAGNVTTLAGNGEFGSKDGPGIDAKFNLPRGLALDRQRRILYVADYENHRVRVITLP